MDTRPRDLEILSSLPKIQLEAIAAGQAKLLSERKVRGVFDERSVANLRLLQEMLMKAETH